jgi:hypothetical protein
MGELCCQTIFKYGQEDERVDGHAGGDARVGEGGTDGGSF